jgi:hypothetical protein
MALAEHRFRPGFDVAFDAWRATHPETNPNAPRGPTYMPQYHQPGLREANALNDQADAAFAAGASDGETADKYAIPEARGEPAGSAPPRPERHLAWRARH